MDRDTATRTRSFEAPAGTVINGFTLPRSIRVTRTYDPRDQSSSSAQKAARRDVAEAIRSEFPDAPSFTLTALQSATSVVQRSRGRVSGGRRRRAELPKTITGFRGESKNGFETWQLGSRKGGVLSNVRDRISAFFEDRTARPRTAAPLPSRITLFAEVDEEAQYWLAGDEEEDPESGVITARQKPRQYATTITFDAHSFDATFPTNQELTFGPTVSVDGDKTNGTGLDISSVRHVIIHIDNTKGAGS